jgi:hypothetical protein
MVRLLNYYGIYHFDKCSHGSKTLPDAVLIVNFFHSVCFDQCSLLSVPTSRAVHDLDILTVPYKASKYKPTLSVVGYQCVGCGT